MEKKVTVKLTLAIIDIEFISKWTNTLQIRLTIVSPSETLRRLQALPVHSRAHESRVSNIFTNRNEIKIDYLKYCLFKRFSMRLVKALQKQKYLK